MKGKGKGDFLPEFCSLWMQLMQLMWLFNGFMSDALQSGRKLRTFNLIDDFNREALAIEIDTSLPAERVITFDLPDGGDHFLTHIKLDCERTTFCFGDFFRTARYNVEYDKPWIGEVKGNNFRIIRTIPE